MRQVDLAILHGEFFNDFGFKFNKSHLFFEKKTDFGKQVIFIHYTDYPDANMLEYELGVRIERIERLIHKFLPTLKDYADRSITVVQPLNKIGKELPKQFIIKNDYELSEIIMKVEKFFVAYGFTWLDEMSNPLNLEQAFLKKENNCFKTQNFVYNAFRATALSRIYNPKDYPTVRENFLKQIDEKRMTPFTLASFLQFLNYLDNMD